MYVVKDLVILVTYRYTLEHVQKDTIPILSKNMFNVIYVVECLVRILTYRSTLEHILVINRIWRRVKGGKKKILGIINIQNWVNYSFIMTRYIVFFVFPKFHK